MNPQITKEAAEIIEKHFDNNFNCYAETEEINYPAMSRDQFLLSVSELITNSDLLNAQGLIPLSQHQTEVTRLQEEVERLKVEVKRQELIIHGMEEGCEEWRSKCADLEWLLERAYAVGFLNRTTCLDEADGLKERWELAKTFLYNLISCTPPSSNAVKEEYIRKEAEEMAMNPTTKWYCPKCDKTVFDVIGEKRPIHLFCGASVLPSSHPDQTNIMDELIEWAEENSEYIEAESGFMGVIVWLNELKAKATELRNRKPLTEEK